MNTAAPKNGLGEWLHQQLAPLVPNPEMINDDATLESLGIDSIDLIELTQLVEDDLGVFIPTDEVKKLKPTSVGDLVTILSGYMDR